MRSALLSQILSSLRLGSVTVPVASVSQHELAVEASHVALAACLVHDTRCQALDNLLGAAQPRGQLADDVRKVHWLPLLVHQAQRGGHGQLLPAQQIVQIVHQQLRWRP